MNTPDGKRYLSVAETARELRVSRQSVYRAVESGDLAHVRLRPNGAVRIPVTRPRSDDPATPMTSSHDLHEGVAPPVSAPPAPFSHKD